MEKETMSNEETTPAEEIIVNENATSAEETRVTGAEGSVDEEAGETSEAAGAERSKLEVPPAAEAPEPTLCHSVEGMVPPAAQGEELVSDGAVDEDESEESHSKNAHTLMKIYCCFIRWTALALMLHELCKVKS